MDFGKIKGMSVGDAAVSVATEGGAVIGGLIGAGVLGKQVEKIVKVATPTSSMLDKALAYAGNNVPKLAVYYMLKKGKTLGVYSDDVGKGILGSVVLDTLSRADNEYAPKVPVKLFGIEFLGNSYTASASTPQMQENMQKVLQENSSLRQQLNSTLQKLASASPNVTVTPFPPDHDRQYGMMQSTPEAEERRRKYGAMTPPIEDERNRRYGAMNKAKLNFAGETDSMSAAFGML